jgi:hypothetical protein
MPYYQFVEKDEIRFGNTDLVLKGGFQNVTSHINPPASQSLMNVLSNNRGGPGQSLTESEASGGSHFCFGNDLTQKNKVESIIPGEPKFTPSKLEVWAFGN